MRNIKIIALFDAEAQQRSFFRKSGTIILCNYAPEREYEKKQEVDKERKAVTRPYTYLLTLNLWL
jgi:hypothetical protein